MCRQMSRIRRETLSGLLLHGIEFALWSLTSSGLQLSLSFRAASTLATILLQRPDFDDVHTSETEYEKIQFEISTDRGVIPLEISGSLHASR